MSNGIYTTKSVERRGRTITMYSNLRNNLMGQGLTRKKRVRAGGECKKWAKELRKFVDQFQGEKIWSETPGAKLSGFPKYVRKNQLSQAKYKVSLSHYLGQPIVLRMISNQSWNHRWPFIYIFFLQ